MSFPNKTPDYRAARDALLASEIALRRQMEAVAAQLRGLPPGGEVPEDYVFDLDGAGGATTVIRMSELFRGGDTLMILVISAPSNRSGPSSTLRPPAARRATSRWSTRAVTVRVTTRARCLAQLASGRLRS
jgi:predicted dithiol-disulfide oxidoreductase (DUF899 family)